MSWIQLTGKKHDNEVWVNFDRVVLIEPIEGGTKLFFSDDHTKFLVVKEDIVSELKKGQEVFGELRKGFEEFFGGARPTRDRFKL